MFQVKNGKKSKFLRNSNSTLFKLSVLHALRKKRWVTGTFILKKAIENIKPLFVIKKRKKLNQVIPLKPATQYQIARRQLGKNFHSAKLIYDSYLKRSTLFKQKVEVHRVAEANRMRIRA